MGQAVTVPDRSPSSSEGNDEALSSVDLKTPSGADVSTPSKTTKGLPRVEDVARSPGSPTPRSVNRLAQPNSRVGITRGSSEPSFPKQYKASQSPRSSSPPRNGNHNVANEMLKSRSVGDFGVLKPQRHASTSSAPSHSSSNADSTFDESEEARDAVMQSLPAMSSIGLQRGRRVIRRRRSGEDGLPARRVSFRARMRYDLVLDRTSSMRRGRNPGRLTLITTSKMNGPVGDEDDEDQPKSLSPNEICLEDVHTRLARYNQMIGREAIWVTADGTALEGYLDVQLQLKQPIHVMKLNTISGLEVQASDRASRRNSQASMHVVRLNNCLRTALVSSEMIAAELIQQLISNYAVVENPRTFALFECSPGRDSFAPARQLDDEERPLLLQLIWGPSSGRMLQLREARRRSKPLPDAAESSAPVESVGSSSVGVDWESFTVPELENFLEILVQEEKRQVEELEERYAKARHKLLELCCEKARVEEEMFSKGCIGPNGSIATLV